MAFSRVGASCSLASRRLISGFQSGIVVLPSAFDLPGVFRTFSFGDAQIGEVRDRSRSNPQCNLPCCLSVLEIVDYQDRLRLVMHVQARLVAARLDLHFRPLARREVYVTFVLSWELLAQSLPREVRVRDVLRRMVAPHLIVGAAIRRAQVKAFVFRRVRRDAESYADEAARACPRSGARFTRQFDFDHAVLKFSLIQDDELNSVCDVGRSSISRAQRFAPLVGHLFRFYIAGLQLVGIVQWNGCGLELCEPRTQRQRPNSDQDKHGLFHQPARTEARVSPKSMHNSSLFKLLTS